MEVRDMIKFLKTTWAILCIAFEPIPKTPHVVTETSLPKTLGDLWWANAWDRVYRRTRDPRALRRRDAALSRWIVGGQ